MPIEIFSWSRKSLSRLFALADDSPNQIASYMSLGEILVAREDDLVVGHVQIVQTENAGVFDRRNGSRRYWQFALISTPWFPNVQDCKGCIRPVAGAPGGDAGRWNTVA